MRQDPAPGSHSAAFRTPHLVPMLSGLRGTVACSSVPEERRIAIVKLILLCFCLSVPRTWTDTLRSRNSQKYFCRWKRQYVRLVGRYPQLVCLGFGPGV